MRLASYVPGELIPLPLSGSIPELPHVAKVFWEGERKFLDPLMRFACGEVRDMAASGTPNSSCAFDNSMPANTSLTQASPPAANRLRDWRDAPAAGSGSKRQAWRYETRDQACANGRPPLEPYLFVRQAHDMRR
jgi:hypothetical protein